MTYVDGFLAPVRTDRKAEYIAFAQKSAAWFREHGALRIVETWSDDVPHGKTTDFYMAVKAEDGESLVFSWIEWPSKEIRDAAWQKMMADPQMASAHMPFDGRRLIYGGFAQVVDVAGAS